MLCSIWTKPRTARRRSRALPRGVTTMRGGSPRQNRAAARVLWVVSRGKFAGFELIPRTCDGKEVK
jgi:hypothetical protein